MKITSIMLMYSDEDILTSYIVRFESIDRTNNFDGQMTIIAEGVNLDSLKDIVRQRLTQSIN